MNSIKRRERHIQEEIRIAQQEKQEAEQRAAEALNARQQAEAAADEVSQLLQQERTTSAENLRRAIAENERAQRERQEAEQRLQVAMEEGARASQSKAKAEKELDVALRTAEQERKDKNYLYEEISAINTEDTRRAQELQELRERNASLVQEKQHLEAANRQLELAAATSSSGEKTLSFVMTEVDFYPSERRDAILNVILLGCKQVHEDSRSAHIAADLLKQNLPAGTRESLEKDIYQLFKGYRKMTPAKKRELQKLGFELASETNHYKYHFYGDARYTIVFAKTPSDNRAADNIVSDIRRVLL